MQKVREGTADKQRNVNAELDCIHDERTVQMRWGMDIKIRF